MPSDLTPDELEKLADALYANAASRYLGRFTRAELRTLARDAASVGARTALEDAAKKWRWSDWSNVLLPKSPIMAEANKVGDWIANRAAAHTTDEETTT
jgi:hypothetical protein